MNGFARAFLVPLLAMLPLAGCTGGGGGGDDHDAPAGDPTTGSWCPGFGLPGASGAGAQVHALLRGTDGVSTYVGGSFREIGTVEAPAVALWNGSVWNPVGGGLDGFVSTLAQDGAGTLYAAGDFASEEGGPNPVLRFADGSWEALTGELDGPVHSAVVHGSSLVIGGAFTDAGGTAVSGIARWDGTGWVTVGTSGVFGEVRSLEMVDGTTLCAAGTQIVDFLAGSRVGCFDGSSWSYLGDWIPGLVEDIARDDSGTWIAGGSFAYVIDPMTGEYLAGLARLEGSTWAPYAGGVDGGFINSVRALAFEDDGDLLVGGTFEIVGGTVPASNIARLTPSGTWSEVGGGVVNLVGVFLGSVIGVNDILVEEDGSVLVGGVFSHGGDTVATNLARERDGDFEAVVPPSDLLQGLSGLANAITVDGDGGVVVGGYFAGVGSLTALNVARLDADGWEALGDGLNSVVRDLHLTEEGALVAGGDFDHSGAAEALFLARWNGTDWESFTPDLDGPVMAIAEKNGRLYLGGDFLTAGGETVKHVVRWDGESFQPLGEGFDSRVTSLAFDHRGRLIAGGLFTASGDTEVLGIARWNGSAWEPLGAGFDGPYGGYASDIEVIGSDVYVGGSFDQVDGQPISALARWDGDEWHPVGGTLGPTDPVTPIVVDLARYGDGLFVTGTFEQAGSTPARYVAWFDGEAWHPLGEGLSDLAERLAVEGETAWAVGGFLRAGGLPSSGIAAWDFAAP